MPGFLASILPALASAATSFIAGAGQTAGGAVANSLLGGSATRVRREDVDHNQNMADLVNPREIARQSAFLTGIAPAQADAYNTYQDATHAADTTREVNRLQTMAPVQAQADLQYMDTVYAGTSPWERLGSSAAPSISAPNPTGGAPSRATPDMGSQFLPLIQAQIQADTARDVAGINAMSQQSIARMNNETSLKSVGIQTDDGNLPKQQTASAAAQQMLAEAQTDSAVASTQKTYQDINNSTVANFLALIPTESVDLGLYKYSQRPGWQSILPILTSELAPGDKRNSINAAIAKMPAPEINSVKRDALQMAAILGKGTQAAMSGGKFLQGLFKSKKP